MICRNLGSENMYILRSGAFLLLKIFNADGGAHAR